YNDPAMPAPMIRLVDVADPERQRLLGYGWFRANWSADGKSLFANGVVGQDAFGRGRTGMVRISTGDRADAKPILTKFVGQSPCPSPDGKSVVFCTVEGERGRVQ
ncbi:MAG TPA: hypothetical protein VF170_07330, partial [Planctomycetaceae bacterium]